MIKRYEKITLNGRNFTLDHKMAIPYPTDFNVKSVDDVYGRCSDVKRSIWREWSDWFYNNNGMCTVTGHNCNFFTIEGKVDDMETGKKYWCYITYANNYCYELV